MTPFELVAALMAVIAVTGWINVKTFHLPHGVAMLIAGLVAAAAIAALQWSVPDFPLASQIVDTINRIDFGQTVVGYMLAFLLFAGAMQVDVAELQRRWLSVTALATLGVCGSIVIVGFGLWYIAGLLGLSLPLIWALLFGALISPTDPVAVLATVRHVKLSKTLTVVLQAEALFNDGVGIVAFTALLAVAAEKGDIDASQAVFQVLVEAVGGLALGVGLSWLVLRVLETIDDFAVETSMSIALAMGTYSLAQSLHLSGPIAVVGAGMVFGGPSGKRAFEGQSRTYLMSFWVLVDEILNALLFLLLGVEMVVVPFQAHELGLLLVTIPLVLAARFAVVQPWAIVYRFRQGETGPALILGWGGLHGALSLALALTLPTGAERSLILSLTYAVVAFSIIVQGLTLTPLARLVYGASSRYRIQERNSP
ncbi:MAG: sodium:proton antiporter [Alphaproteobacteria bacterium]|nr:sodium:proton antiporter [Alphaproteobacteria bacterium]MBL6937017.1 sodium:proton antiporter [Alphaproteobacteria bacterium]MBL7097786.1 sodium:proton antiporter [Alphaproteobacteria bacterium]